jgi:hypothetical protein
LLLVVAVVGKPMWSAALAVALAVCVQALLCYLQELHTQSRLALAVQAKLLRVRGMSVVIRFSPASLLVAAVLAVRVKTMVVLVVLAVVVLAVLLGRLVVQGFLVKVMLVADKPQQLAIRLVVVVAVLAQLVVRVLVRVLQTLAVMVVRA